MLGRFSTHIPQTFTYVELSVPGFGSKVPRGTLRGPSLSEKIFKKRGLLLDKATGKIY